MSDEGYVHQPGEVTGAADADEPSAAGRRQTAAVSTDGAVSADDAPGGEPPVEETSTADRRKFGVRGWVLVGWLVVALVVVPLYLYAYPYAGETLSLFGLGYRDTYLFVPLLPALILGVLAVWAATRR